MVSECTSIFSSLQYSEIDIATHEDYRGQGLASSIVKTFIDHCLENDIIPRWDCDILNKSSIKLAGKSGFGNPVNIQFLYKKHLFHYSIKGCIILNYVDVWWNVIVKRGKEVVT